MKNNWWKIILATGVLLIGFSIFYYYVVFLPHKEQTKLKQEQKDEQEFIFSMKRKCQEGGDKIYQKDIEELGKYKMCVPEYSYNRKLNTCLYFSCHIEKDWLNKWVKDVFGNNEIISFIESKGEVVTFGCPTCVSSNEEFEKQKQELFTQ